MILMMSLIQFMELGVHRASAFCFGVRVCIARKGSGFRALGFRA